MFAKIYRPARTAMQSGKAGTKEWVLEFEAEQAKTIEPLMGYSGSGDTQGQIRLKFESKEAAIDYATRHAIPHQVTEVPEAKRVIKSYSDNFAFRRKKPWTH